MPKRKAYSPRVEILPRRAFEDNQDLPCPVCLRLAQDGLLPPRAVMPLPRFPPRLRQNGIACCRDCQAVDTSQTMLRGQHSEFAAARLTIANERCEGLVMPAGMMEHFGLCKLGVMAPCSMDDLDAHLAWLTRYGIPTDTGCVPFSAFAAKG